MAMASIFAVIFLSAHLVLIHSTDEDDKKPLPICPKSFQCGNHTTISFPFTNHTYSHCGIELHCPKKGGKIQLRSQFWYDVESINDSILKIHDPVLEQHIAQGSCDDTFKNLTLPYFPFVSFIILNNLTFFKCNNTPHFITHSYIGYRDCPGGSTVYYKYPDDDEPTPPAESLPRNQCSAIQLPVLWPRNNTNPGYPFGLLNATFPLKWHISHDCQMCLDRGRQCLNIKHKFVCREFKGKRNYRLILGTAIPGFVILALLILIIWRRYKWNYVFSYFLSRNNTSFHPSSKTDLEGGSIFFGIPVFSYAELEEATNNFDPKQELGDGGFGTVYHGKLRDGREVAVKRLYNHNYKRMEQFKNEIEILAGLRHRNLVTLYGCTSRHSRELLLVYEYIPNGTLADHLHGDQAKPGSLPWPIRMNIAIETTTALVYLHASDIIHRDVKTNNILLDNNFCVKVGDFGLSRLLPTDVTHVSTAPQGTPGYLDPEYSKCYQLTNKSDVYSFGVVLIELISSLPAVDVGRHRHEINLADLAVNRILNCAFNELIDPCLGFESDGAVQRMTSSVAELAFRCLQYERELRPTMDEVLETLMAIQGHECNVGALKSKGPPLSPESDDVALLKTKEIPPSPVSVTDGWVSRSTTPNTSV
ncbi:LEAF RUST 10 DISEASE-RESISTANCE LOCUS RECEPTOR-LIKE PROTEIN KINASE-like 1.1 [Cornus florida]|uniref:LEAF RUST 10 DISEASE-RESISTANCE LOCUS RECEPTOR-LIKE PROTEIN KINASE-like 1.1 n=1 Tax=Cornus florida TaxID=4283 RepID=UPI0028972FB7|nr:LEAF RUST 10 DISEASE-RESISTANCE LOCUS RECEPTOR-LIKE PROTEIN KINASE-like 1.1 [Cornus florida]